MNLYIDEYNCRISISGNKLILTKDSEIKTFPTGNIDSISINKNVQITSQAICKLSEENIDISWFSSNQMICHTCGSKNIFRLKQQFDLLNNDKFRLQIAKKNIASKINNQMYFIDKQKQFKVKDVKKNNSVESLLGVEGKYAVFYFSELKNRFPDKYNFKTRKKHPPEDPVNSVLSFAYALLYNKVTSVINQHGLNPSVGFCHTLKNNHYALSSDLMESLRCDICDSIAVELFSKMPDSDEFQNTDNGVMLSKGIKQYIISEFHNNLNKRASTENGFSDDFNGVINQIVCSYGKALETQDISYFKPYMAGENYDV